METGNGKPRIFVGHGGASPLWRELKDYIQEFDLEVETFESRSRAGQTVPTVVAEMLQRADFAFLVHTGEDETRDNKIRARQNVIHETGLFQGKLGYEKAIVLREDGVEEFSNSFGIVEIRFPKGDIGAAFGEVSRVLRKSFPRI